MKILTFLSDFGQRSSYVAQMKAVALSISDVEIIDISHNISPQNIREGAYLLKSTVPFFPSGTVHVAVIDPGVGTERRGIVIATKTQILVGPDNGLLIPAAEHLGNFEVYEIKNQNLLMNNISNTFHGRDVFTPVAAHILNGLYFEKIGQKIFDYKTINLKDYKFDDKTAEGKVLYIDDFGNIITNIEGHEIKKQIQLNKKIMLYLGKDQLNIPFVKTYGEVDKDKTLATIGSSNYLEISINMGNAKEKYKTKIGDDVKILFS